MIVTLKPLTCLVEREQGDPKKFYDGSWGSGESRLLYHLQKELNKMGYDFVKKRMWKDGHMVDADQLYLRERKKNGERCLAIFNSRWAIAGANEDYNRYGAVTFSVFNLNEEPVNLN
jgi:hypothetical protein